MDNNQATTNVGGTLAKGVLGIYEFNIKRILKEAWHRVHGIKGTYWKAFFLTLLVILGTLVSFFLIIVIGDLIASHWFHISKTTIIFYNKILIVLFQVASTFLYPPLVTGIIMIGVKRSVDEKMWASDIFQYYRYWQKLWVLPIIMILIELAMDSTKGYWWAQLLLFLVYLYFSVSYIMFYPLIAEKKLAVWEALESSRKAISHHWFKMLWFLILISLILIGSLLTVGIAFIWTLPMLNNAVGILYREMFGVQKTSSQEIYV